VCLLTGCGWLCYTATVRDQGEALIEQGEV